MGKMLLRYLHFFIGSTCLAFHVLYDEWFLHSTQSTDNHLHIIVRNYLVFSAEKLSLDMKPEGTMP